MCDAEVNSWATSGSTLDIQPQLKGRLTPSVFSAEKASYIGFGLSIAVVPSGF
jgi:hypothetical protein